MKYTLALYALRLLGRLPLGGARVLGAMVGLLAWLKRGRSYQVTSANLARCFPECSPDRRRWLVRKSLIETGKTAAEAPIIWRLSAQALFKRIHGVEAGEAMDAALNKGKGVLVLAPHLGNWELVAPFLASYKPLTALYQPPRHPRMHEFVLRGRSKEGICMVPTNGRGVAQLLASLKRGEIVGVLPDQVPDAGSGVQKAPFFDQPAPTMTLVHSLIKRTDCSVLLVFAQRVPGGFRVRVMEPDPSIYSQVQLASVAALNRSIEAAVRLVPAQYQWEYNRFRGLV